MNNCYAREEGVVKEYASWDLAPKDDAGCPPTCWETLEGTVKCMEGTVATMPTELAITGPEDVSPDVVLGGVLAIVLGIALLRSRKA